MGRVQFNLTVNACLPGLCEFGIVAAPGLVDPVQDGTDVAVIRLDKGGVQLPEVLPEPKMDFGESADIDLHSLRLIADQMGGQGGQVLGARFQGELAFEVRRDADDGSVEIDAGEGDGLPGFGVSDASPDPGRLGARRKGNEQQEREEILFPGHQKSRSRPMLTPKSRPLRCVSFQKQSTRRRWKMLAMPTPAST